MSKSRPSIFISPPSPTLTPPVFGKFKYAPISNVDGDLAALLEINRTSGYDGIYTGGISYCVVVTIVERDAEGVIQNLLMIHFAGGINEERFLELMKKISQREMKGGYRELVVTGGCTQGNIESFKEYLANSFNVKDIDNYFLNYYQRNLKLCLQKTIYAIPGVGSGSALVTFNGYAGTCYDNMRIFYESHGHDLTINQYNSSNEKLEWKKMEHLFDANEYDIKKIRNTIKQAACDAHAKERLYFYTRQYIYNMKFTQLDKGMIRKNYIDQIKKIPLSTKTENIVTTITCILGIGFITTLPYLLFQKHRRAKKIETTEHEAKLSSETQGEQIPFLGSRS